jgi:hypothetical protein
MLGTIIIIIIIMAIVVSTDGVVGRHDELQASSYREGQKEGTELFNKCLAPGILSIRRSAPRRSNKKEVVLIVVLGVEIEQKLTFCCLFLCVSLFV